MNDVYVAPEYEFVEFESDNRISTYDEGWIDCKTVTSSKCGGHCEVVCTDECQSENCDSVCPNYCWVVW